MKKTLTALLASTALAAGAAMADITVELHAATEDGAGDSVGTVTISESEHGLVFTPELNNLKPGILGFHVHENPSCDPAEENGKMVPAGAAGGHMDSENTDKHGTPWGDGHLGDLPPLYVDDEGNASQPVLAPRLTEFDQVRGHALMVHVGGDNHSDHPEPDGGGGTRMACGVIE